MADTSVLKKFTGPQHILGLFILVLIAQTLYYVMFLPSYDNIEEELRKRALLLKASSGKAPKEDDEIDEQLLMDSISKVEKETGFTYDPVGKRDPFLPFNFAPEQPKEFSATTPLEKYDIGQLKLTAILAGFGEPRAIVENAVGRGFTVTIGTKIGRKGGIVTEIRPEKVIIREEAIDFTGIKTSRNIEMTLRTKSSNN